MLKAPFILLPFKNKKYFILYNFIDIWTYHVKVCRLEFLLAYYIFFLNRAILVHKLGKKKIVKIRLRFMTKRKKKTKIPTTIKLGGGGKGLTGTDIMKIFFLQLSYKGVWIGTIGVLKIFFCPN